MGLRSTIFISIALAVRIKNWNAIALRFGLKNVCWLNFRNTHCQSLGTYNLPLYFFGFLIFNVKSNFQMKSMSDEWPTWFAVFFQISSSAHCELASRLRLWYRWMFSSSPLLKLVEFDEKSSCSVLRTDFWHEFVLFWPTIFVTTWKCKQIHQTFHLRFRIATNE